MGSSVWVGATIGVATVGAVIIPAIVSALAAGRKVTVWVLSIWSAVFAVAVLVQVALAAKEHWTGRCLQCGKRVRKSNLYATKDFWSGAITDVCCMTCAATRCEKKAESQDVS